jgi:hypothetical protein
LRGAFFWTVSTILAFAVTAAVFLTLAEIGTAPPERSLGPGDERRARPEAPLTLELGQNELNDLEEAEGQRIAMTISNGSRRELTDINVYLILSSDNTAKQDTRYYEAEIQRLARGESKRVNFPGLDLSPPGTGDEGEAGESSQEDPDADSFNVLEMRAASSEGASTVKTAALTF